MAFDTTDISDSLPRDPLGPHPWARYPNWDAFVDAAIKRFLAKGGKITYCKYGSGVSEFSHHAPKPKQAGPRKRLPIMSTEQHKLYRKLMANGVSKEEALDLACPNRLGK